MTTTPPDGIYYIEVVGSGQPQYLTREKGSDAAVTILPPSAKPDPAQEVMCFSDEHDCLLFTGHFSGESSTLIMETSSSRSLVLSRVITLLISKAITRNPSEATTSYAVLINAPRTNGSSSQATFVLLVPISVLRWPDPRFIHL